MTPETLLGSLAGHWQAALTAAVVAVTLAALLFVQRAPDMVMIGGVVLLLAAGVISPDEALKGMSNEGMVTVAALFVVAAAVERTGALASLVDRTLGRPKSLATAQVRTMIAPGVISAFTNNTPVVALMVPAIRDWAKKNRFSISKLLMPMNAAVVLGGLCTLIGTSTNVVVSGLVAAKRGQPLGMFDITWLGVPLFAIGLVYLIIASRFLLKDRRPPMSTSDDPRQYSLEMVVDQGSPLVGRTIREGQFRSTYGAVVIAVARDGERLQMKIGDIVLQPGDTLLVEAGQAFIDRQRTNRHFYLVSEVTGSTPPRHDKAWIACTVLAAMVLAAALELVPMVAAALVAACAVVGLRCISSTEARRSIEWESLLLIAASFGLARAMEKTGLAEMVAHSTIAAAGDNPYVVLAALYLVTMLFTELMSNNAAAVLTFPIAWQTAADLGVNPMPLVMAITVAASCGFATPMGYQTNLMIYGPGGYKFSDYMRFGGPLNLLVMAVTVALAPLIWSFWP